MSVLLHSLESAIIMEVELSIFGIRNMFLRGTMQIYPTMMIPGSVSQIGVFFVYLLFC